jgi:transposase
MVPGNTQRWVVAEVTDLRRVFTGLSGLAQTVLKQNPLGGGVYIFRGRRGDLVKILWHDGDGLSPSEKARPGTVRMAASYKRNRVTD